MGLRTRQPKGQFISQGPKQKWSRKSIDFLTLLIVACDLKLMNCLFLSGIFLNIVKSQLIEVTETVKIKIINNEIDTIMFHFKIKHTIFL